MQAWFKWGHVFAQTVKKSMETRQKSTFICHRFLKSNKRDPKTPTNFKKLELAWRKTNSRPLQKSGRRDQCEREAQATVYGNTLVAIESCVNARVVTPGESPGYSLAGGLILTQTLHRLKEHFRKTSTLATINAVREGASLRIGTPFTKAGGAISPQK